MKVEKLQLKGFKRFDDLTLDLGANPARIVALVGPNGCGKSSVFDGFVQYMLPYKGGTRAVADSFLSKYLFHRDSAMRNRPFQRDEAVQITWAAGSSGVSKNSFHMRSSYRFTSRLNVQSISAQPNLLDDTNRPAASVDLDSRLQENYTRILGQAISSFWTSDKTGEQVRTELIGRINAALKNVLDVRISDLGDVTRGKGQLHFEKDETTDFPYENLSSGEKEVIDLLIDLIVRSKEYDDTIYCIDEPELHLNTAIQRKVLIEIDKIIPSNCQLWIATHSIGFLRALQEELAHRSAVIDFSEKAVFRGAHVIRPMARTRENWQRIFETSLDDLVRLIAPERIIYCEGRADPTEGGDEQGLDAVVYNEVFGPDYPATLFISSGGTHEVKANGSLAIKVLSKAFLDVDLLLLHDRDERTETERAAWLAKAPHHRMLNRREIENYLLDFEVLAAYCRARGRVIKIPEYDAIVRNPAEQDLKVGRVIHDLKVLCGENHTGNAAFMKALARHVRGTGAYADLNASIFSVRPSPALSIAPKSGAS